MMANEFSMLCASTIRDTMETRSDERFAVLKSIAEECIYEDGLCQLLKKGLNPTCYVWFEPSHLMGIEQCILKTIYVNKMVKAGCIVKILMADWFLQRHYRIGSNLNKIRAIGCSNIALWKAAGMYIDKVDIKWLSDEMNHHALDYWPLAMDVSRRYPMRRLVRYSSYMGSPYKGFYGPAEFLPASEIIQPCMQVAAVLCQKADVWLFSMAQQDIIMLAKDYCDGIYKGNKPTILLHRMLPNLLEDPDFQYDSHPGRTIFMGDEEKCVYRKISNAFCPPTVPACNPCLEYIKYIAFPWFGKLALEVWKEGNCKRITKMFSSMDELIFDYESGALDSKEVKLVLHQSIMGILKPVIDRFWTNPEAQDLISAARIEDVISEDMQKIRMQNRELVNLDAAAG